MTTKELTVAALTVLAASGGVYVLDKGGKSEQVKLVPDTTRKTELPSKAAAAILVDDAGVPRVFQDGAVVQCRPGGNLDGVWRDDIEWCSDGAGQTWTRAAVGAETIQVVGGRAYSMAAP